MKHKDFITSCAEKYKKLTPAETQRLKTRYEANKKSYEAAIEIWNKKMTQDGKITELQKSLSWGLKDWQNLEGWGDVHSINTEI